MRKLQSAEERDSSARAAQLIRSFRQVHRSMLKMMRIQADLLDLTPVQMMVLHALSEEPNLSLSDLAERVQLGCSTVSGVVKRLVEAGILERKRLEEDQRTIAIRLTEKGNQLDEQAFGDDSLMSKALRNLLQFPVENIDTLLALHQQLTEILDTEGERKRDE